MTHTPWTVGYGPKGITGPTAAYTFAGIGKYELITELDESLPDGCHRVVCIIPCAKDAKQAESIRLIAAAPELLEALKQIADKGAWQEHIDQARAAIAKATGGAQ